MMIRIDGVKGDKLNLNNEKNDYAYDIYKIEKECFSEPWSEKCIRETINNQNSYFAVAALNADIIGYAGMYFVNDEGYIYNIAVKKEYRKFGVGSGLLNQLEKHSNFIKLKFLSLEVRETNLDGIRLYKKFNFEEKGKRKNFYNSPKEDAIIMTKYFQSNGDVVLYENTCNRNIV